MKILAILAISLLSASADPGWTHRTVEGQGGGPDGDYFFFKAFRPKRATDTMSILRARAIYASDHPSSESIMFVDYSFVDGVHVKVMSAKRSDAEVLFSGGDVNAEVLRDYVVKSHSVRGQMVTPAPDTKLTEEQQGDLFNLIHVLALQRVTWSGEP